MCGRFTLSSSADEIRAEFGVDVPPDYQPRYNIAPQQLVPVLGKGEGGALRIGMLQWGLVPYWADDPRGGPKAINARAETLLQRPTFRDPFLCRRCLVPADGFYEWAREGGTRRPFRFRLRGDRLLSFAGVWDRWKRPDGESLYTCAIITTPASALVGRVHDRMPAIIAPEQREAWLDPAAHPDALAALLRPYERDDLECYAVSPLVNRVSNDSPECIAPVPPGPGASTTQQR
jgi:putative SOS response-associated peptidase YedK